MYTLRTRLVPFVFTALGALALGGLSASGCQEDSSGTGSSSNDGDDDDASGGSGASSSSANGGEGGSSSTSTSSNNGGAGGGTGGGTSCDAPERTIAEITTGAVGPDVVVNLNGVVAMSTKFLIFDDDDTCLWGMFVSAPGLTETAPNTGLLIVSYGDNPVSDGNGNFFCPKLGERPTGGTIPDNVLPGDVLDINGKTAYYKPSTCGQNPGESTVSQYQISSNLLACPITKTGTAAVPTPATLSAADAALLASPTDKAFHDKWGGVKVRIENVTAEPHDANCGMMDMPPCIVNQYGEMALSNGLIVKDKLYYRGYLKDVNFCHDGPIYSSDTAVTFASIEGFSRQDYCTWLLDPADKCADLDPPSEDCKGAMECPPTTAP
jgi:hypothetical protein